MRHEAVEEAIARAGSASELARRLGISSQAVSQWKLIPADRVGQVARATGISPERLRPDIFADIAVVDDGPKAAA